MRTTALALALTVGVAVSPAWALDYVNGKVVQNAPYSGPELSAQDVGMLATGIGTAVAIYQVNPPLAGGLATVAFLTWGALRTAAHRPNVVKQQIHTNLDAQHAEPVDGSVASVIDSI